MQPKIYEPASCLKGTRCILRKIGATDRTRAVILAAVVSLAPLSAIAFAQEPAHSQGKGAVLCVWLMYSSALHTGEKCFRIDDADFLSVLRSGLKGIEAFIFRNSNVTAKDLAEYNSRRPALVALQCSPDNEIVRLYHSVKQQGIRQLQQNIDALLAEERPALSNPCL